MKTLQNHFVRSTLFLLFALLCPILVQAQGTPWLSNNDFSVTITKGNSTCNAPGVVSIKYRNAVVGFQTLHYSFSNDNISWDITQDAAPGDIVVQTLNDWEDGDRLYINVYATTTDGTKTQSVQLMENNQSGGSYIIGFNYSASTIANADIISQTEISGSCGTTAGSISMALNMQGFSTVEWKVYQGTTLIKTINSTTPTTPTIVDQISAGTYRIVARATPSCTTTHPTPTTPKASWDGDVLVLTSEIEVEALGVLYENITPATGGCGGAYNAYISGLNGVATYTSELLPRGGGAAIQTVMGNGPGFGFNDILAGDYTIRITTDCGTVFSKDITVRENAPLVYASYDSSAQNISLCAKGAVICSTNTPKADIPQTYRLIRLSDNHVIATKTWKAEDGNWQCRFENLSLSQNEDYIVEADFCNITAKSQSFKPNNNLPQINWEVLTPAADICSGQGGRVKIKITTPQNIPLTLAGTLEVKNPDGTILSNQSLPTGWSGEVILNDVLPTDQEQYSVRFTLDCNGLTGEYKGGYMGMNSKYYYISISPEAKIEQCIPQYAVKFYPSGSTGNGLQSLIDGTYELRKQDGTLIWQGNYVPDYNDPNGAMRISVPDEGTYFMIVRSSCGSYVVKSSGITVTKPQIAQGGNVYIQSLPLPCYATGYVRINPYFITGTAVNEIFWELEKDGLPYRNGRYNYNKQYNAFDDLPAGKYKLITYPQCAPTMKQEINFELKSELTPLSFSTDGSCGAQILGETKISFYTFNPVSNTEVSMSGWKPIDYPYSLYNADTGVLYQEGKLDLISPSGNSDFTNRGDFSQRLPSGNYRMEIKPHSLICGGLTPYIYNFTVPAPQGNVFVLASDTDKHPVKVVNTPYKSNGGSITVGLYPNENSGNPSRYRLNSNNFPIQITLRSKDGSITKTLTALGLEKNVTFENLPAGLYTLSTDIDGSTCIPEQTVKVETTSDAVWSASAHLSPRCNQDPQRPFYVSFRVAGTLPTLATTVYTFKVFVWDDVAADYVLAGSVTGGPGQLTATIDIAEYTGTSAPPLDNTPLAPLAPYKYVIEEGGKEVYATLDVQDKVGYNYYHLPQFDMTLTQPTTHHPTGTATFSLKKKITYYSTTETYPAGLSLKDKIVWTCQRSGSNEILKVIKADMFTPVTFENLPPGRYYVNGQLLLRGCSAGFNTAGSFEIQNPPIPPSPTDPLTEGLKLEVQGVNGVCDSDCKIKVKVQNDPMLITKVTYTISYRENDDDKEKVSSTTNSAQEISFEGLPPGNYKVQAKAEVPTPDGLKIYTAEKQLTLQTFSPDMNIVQHTEATRSSFKHCATGYLAFKFQDDSNAYSSYGISRTFNDDYEFVITNAPTGFAVPVSFKPTHLSTLNNETVAITPFRNLPAGEYKLKIVNHCKTLFLTCHINEMEILDLSSGPLWNHCFDLNRYRSMYGYCPSGSDPLCFQVNKGKYYFNYTPFQDFNSYFRNKGSLMIWDDLITQDFHDTFGQEMKNVPFTSTPKELTVRLWAIDKVTLKFNCSAIADKVFTGTMPICEDAQNYCGNPSINLTDLIRRTGFPETFTLVVNEMNGAVIGNEVLRQVNPNQTYSLGTVRKKFIARLYTTDNILLYQLILNPVDVANAMSLDASYSRQDCQHTNISGRLNNPILDCYSPYVAKLYTGDGTHTLLREILINSRESHPSFFMNGLTPNTNYEVELYTADGQFLDHKTVHTPSIYPTELPTTYYFGNTCNNAYTNTVVKTFRQNGKQMNKMYYQLKYIYATGFDNSKKYYWGPTVLSVVKNGITYKYLSSLGSSKENWLSSDWFVERNGLLYRIEPPIFEWDETINATLTAAECGLSVNITGKASRLETNFQNPELENLTMEQTCTGWDITPGGKISYLGLDGNRHTLTYKEYRDPKTGIWKDVNTPFAQPKSPNSFSITLRSDDLCDINVTKSNLVYKPHVINKIESASYYCSGNNKGRIYVGAQDGVPPYKYELLNGENETDPVVETKTDTGPVVFEYGNVGQKYRVHVWDACGNLRIHYLTTVVSTVDLGYELSKTRQLCAGDNLRLTMQSFPGATYDWTLPDGTHRNTRNLDLGPATRAMAGAYNVVITPSDCNSTINATITVVVDDIGAPSWTPAMQTICQGTTTTLSPGAAQSYTDNTPGTPKYQWQRRDPYGSSFSDIDGATMADYNFQADTPGTYTFRRVTTYKGCEHTSDEAQVVVTPGPIQTLSPAELDRTVRKGSTGYTLTGGSLQTNGTSIASYKWERSTDGSTWTTVGTTVNYKETQKFKLEKVYYRRTVTPTVGTCAHTTPVITVTFKKMRAAYVNPHIRTRVKSE